MLQIKLKKKIRKKISFNGKILFNMYINRWNDGFDTPTV